MKKVLAIALALATVLCVFCACGKTTDKNKAKEAEILTEGNYSYTVLEDGTAKIVSFKSEETYDKMNIPSRLGEIDVTVIGTEAFADCDKLQYVIFPTTLTTIEASAFKGSSIKNAMMTSCRDLKTIGDEAFADCADLVQVDVSSSVEDLGDKTFANDTNLIAFTLRGDTPLTISMFEGAKKDMKIWAYDTAVNAAEFAKENGYEFDLLKMG